MIYLPKLLHVMLAFLCSIIKLIFLLVFSKQKKRFNSSLFLYTLVEIYSDLGKV